MRLPRLTEHLNHVAQVRGRPFPWSVAKALKGLEDDAAISVRRCGRLVPGAKAQTSPTVFLRQGREDG